MDASSIVSIRMLIVEAIEHCEENVNAYTTKRNDLVRQIARERNSLAKQRLEAAIQSNDGKLKLTIESSKGFMKALEDFDSMFDIETTTVNPLTPTFPPGVRETHIRIGHCGGVVYRDVYVSNATAKKR
jgi:hypothetical protein